LIPTAVRRIAGDRLNTRVGLLDRTTLVDEHFDHRFRQPRGASLTTPNGEGAGRLRGLPGTIPQEKRFRSLTYEVKDIVGRKGFGIGFGRASRLQHPGGGLDPGAGRRGAVDEAGSVAAPSGS